MRSWGVLGGGVACRDLIIAVGTMAPGFFSGGLPLVVCGALFRVGTTLMLGL